MTELFSMYHMENSTCEPALNGSSIEPALNGSVGPAMNGSVGPAMNGSVGPAMNGSVGPAMNGAIGPAMNGSSIRPMNGPINNEVPALNEEPILNNSSMGLNKGLSTRNPNKWLIAQNKTSDSKTRQPLRLLRRRFYSMGSIKDHAQNNPTKLPGYVPSTTSSLDDVFYDTADRPNSLDDSFTHIKDYCDLYDNVSPCCKTEVFHFVPHRSEEPVISNMDISTGHIVLSYMEDHLKNKDRLDSEWEGLCRYEAEPNSCDVAKEETNQSKNRYADVLPYDHSRVVLNTATNIADSDYINASSITDHDPRNPAYIATQGPLPHTVADFWQMVWEQGSVVIVMLGKMTDNGVAYCHRYWPEEGSDLYHIYEVHLVSEHIWCDDYLVRSFYLKNLQTNETRTVTQFHFLSWPDNGIPSSAKALLDFRRKVNKSYRGRSCPIVVHCSDGMGRTGTYSLIDMVLNRMAKGAKEIDIAATLEHIRDQRMSMVKTKEQFEFVLSAVAEEVHAILKALPQ